MQDKHDAAIDKTLAALGSADAPEGMEARIQQRLQYHAASQIASARHPWQPARGWWQGLLTGAAVSVLLCGATLFGLRGRLFHAHTISQVDIKQARGISPAVVPVGAQLKAAPPCAPPQVRQQVRSAASPHMLLAAEPAKPPRAAAADSLTPQERELVRLAQIASPEELSRMSFEARAQLDAQQSAAFQKFFTPPPPPPHDPGENE